MSFPAYLDNEDSGVKWLGELPSHWQVSRLGFECDTMVPMRDKPTSLKGEIPWIRIEDFDGKYITGSKSGQGVSEETVEEMHLKVFPVGTVLCSCSCAMGATAIVSMPLISNQTFIGIVPHENYHSDFLYYFFQAAEQLLTSIGTGAIQSYLSQDDFRRLRLPFPPLDEQKAISSFLDVETSKIDGLVSEQRRLIELLKEKRQAVISHAVTKGLNPIASMKPSGIQWLGDVPQHWEVSRLKHATSRIVDCPHDTPTYNDDGEYFAIRTSDLNDGKLFPVIMRRVDEAEYEHRIRRESVFQDDIVYSREGGRWGHAALVTENDKFCLGQRMMQFRANAMFDARYLMWHLNSKNVYRQGDVDTVGAAAPHVNVGTICNYRIAKPPTSEQAEIADYLGEILGEFDSLDAEVERAIELLQERRTALITAAVTGKIDVREFVLQETA